MTHKKSTGFTIIEVLIVLAIAGLIMLVIFLAVPALQRNSRNNARNNDASRVLAATQECLNSKNAVTSACTPTIIEDLAGTLSTLESVSTSDTAAQYSINEARVWFGSNCDTAGTMASGGVSSTAFTITYALEPEGSPVNRCVGR